MNRSLWKGRSAWVGAEEIERAGAESCQVRGVNKVAFFDGSGWVFGFCGYVYGDLYGDDGR